MKFLFLFIFLILTSFKTYSDDKYLIIDKNKEYDIRVYFFLDISSCEIHFKSIKNVVSALEKFKIENVIFVNSVKQESAEQLFEELQFDCRIIGDEFGLYWEKFKIDMTPTTLFLDNNGKLISLASPNNRIEIRKIIEQIKLKTVSDKKDDYLELLERIDVKYNGNSFIGGFNHRDLLYDSKREQYFLRNDLKHNFFIINRTGNITKSLSNNEYSEFSGYNSTYKLSWLVKDSILLLNGTIYPFNRFVQYYDVPNDSLYPRIIIDHNQYIALSSTGDTLANNDTFVTFGNSYCNYFLSSLRSRHRDYLPKDIHTLFRYDDKGNIVGKYNSPDTIYQKYKIANWFRESIGNDNNGNVYTLQNFSNLLKIWDKKMNLIQEIQLDLSDLYKFPQFDIPHSRGNTELTRKVENNISRNFHSILIDDVNDMILFAFLNTFMPEGIGDFNHKDVEYSTVLVLFDKNGNRINSEPIVFKSISIPFHFEDKIIYISKLNQSRELQISRYKLNF